MSPTSFQIRVCINPNCGLRYPLINDDSLNDRCPACLGRTDLVTEKPFSITPPNPDKHLKIDYKLYGLLDNIRSAMNVGSILRTADGFEFNHIYLCGITPTPEVPGVRKSSLGAEEYVSWTSHKNAVDLITNLRITGYKIWALEKTQNSIEIKSAIKNCQRPEKMVLIVGNEITGIDPGILELTDCNIHIPMRGMKSSFNVAAAFAIAAQMVHFWFNENNNK